MLLLRNADRILTVDPHRRILKNHSVLIEDGIIRDVGPAAEMDVRHLETCRTRGTVVEATGRLVLPRLREHTCAHLRASQPGLIPTTSPPSPGP
jgi:cytosine/adenosine deaminase-related metal-dependent hydrolase